MFGRATITLGIGPHSSLFSIMTDAQQFSMKIFYMQWIAIVLSLTECLLAR